MGAFKWTEYCFEQTSEEALTLSVPAQTGLYAMHLRSIFIFVVMLNSEMLFENKYACKI